MKFKYYWALLAAVLVMTNCSKEETQIHAVQDGISKIIATVEGKDARSTTDDAGTFRWNSGDQLKVKTGSYYTYYEYEAGGQFVWQSGVSISSNSSYAMYPAAYRTSNKEDDMEFSVASDGKLASVYYPSVYGSKTKVYRENTNAVMVAKVNPQDPSVLNFKHLGGVMRFTIHDVPAGYNSFVFTATGKRITGDFSISAGDLKFETINGEEVYYVEAMDSNEDFNTFQCLFKASDVSRKMTFFVPLPAGTYDDFVVSLVKDDDANTSIQKTYTDVSKVIKRRTLMMMSDLKVENNQLKNNAESDHVSDVTLLKDGQQLTVKGTEETVTIHVPAGTDATAVLNVNIEPEIQNGTFTISDNHGDAEPTASQAKVIISAPDTENTVGTLHIDAPTLSVELADGTYSEVIAKTATETLVIKAGVEIANLTINGGKIVIEEGATVGAMTVNDAAALQVAVEATGTVGLASDIILTAPIEINKDVIVHLNGDITGNTPGSCVFRVKGGTLTINGTEDSHIVAQDVAVWADGGKVIINGGHYSNEHWADLIYAEGVGSDVTINGGTFVASNIGFDNENGTKNEYSALNLSDGSDASIIVYGGTFYKFNPADNLAEGVHTSFVPEGYMVGINGSWYTVNEKINSDSGASAEGMTKENW